MARVFIPPPLRDLTGGVCEVVVEGQSVRGVIESLDVQFPGIARRLCDGAKLASGLSVAIDGMVTPRGLLARVRPDSEVHFLPAIGGGSS